MAGPWEKYQAPNEEPAGTDESASTALPWEKYTKIEPRKPMPEVGRVLDYLGGLGRTAVEEPLIAAGSQLAGGNPVLRSEDVGRALKGLAPSSTELLTRAGVPQGKSLSDVLPGAYSQPGSGGISSFQLPEKGGPADPNLRSALGFAGDVAFDPLTYASAGASAAAKAADANKIAQATNIALNPASAALAGGGEALYKSAFKNIDKDLVAKGKPPVSPELFNEGYIGNMAGARTANNELRQKAGKGIENTLAAGAEKGFKADMFDSTKGAYDLANEMKDSPHPMVQAQGDKLHELINNYAKKGDVPIDVANSWASELNNMAGSTAFDPMRASSVNAAAQGERAIGTGIQENLRKALGEDPDLLQKLQEYNKTYSATKEAQPSFRREFKKEVTKPYMSQIDWALLGGAGMGALHSPQAALTTGALLGGKQLGKLANSTAGRTFIGQGAYNLGQIPGLDPAIRRGIWDQMYQPQGDEQ